MATYTAQPINTGAPAQPQYQAATDPRLACKGIAGGGVYESSNYCGPISLVIGIFLFPCICCCPLDKREEYIEPGTGRRVVL